MEGTVVLFAVGAVGEAVSHRHICFVLSQRPDEIRCGFGGVGVISVYHHIVVCIYLPEHLPDHVAFPLTRLHANTGPMLCCDLRRIIRGVVVIDVNGSLRQGCLEVIHYLAHGQSLVITRDEHRNASPPTGGLYHF